MRLRCEIQPRLVRELVVQTFSCSPVHHFINTREAVVLPCLLWERESDVGGIVAAWG